MMMKMGWKEGKGLGKDESGATTHVKIRKKIESDGARGGGEPRTDGIDASWHRARNGAG